MKVWRKKKRPLPTGSAPAPKEQVVADTAPSPREDQLRQLQDRRSMETRQELDRIRAMGRVDVLKKRLDARLGRNLYRKLNTGPLGTYHKSFSRSVSRAGSLKGKGVARGDHRRVSSDSGLVQSKEDVYVGISTAPFRTQENRRREQVQELVAIEELGVVRSNTDEHSRVRNHIRRMSNHRLMIKPHRGHRPERKKSSVLVTSMEDTEEKARQLYHQQSKVVIDGFMQAPTHKQRVLEKLSSTQVKRISDTLQRGKRKRSSGGSYTGWKDLSSQAPQVSDASRIPPVPPDPLPTAPRVPVSHPPESSSSPAIQGSSPPLLGPSLLGPSSSGSFPSPSAPPLVLPAPNSPTTHSSSVAPPHQILTMPSTLSSSQVSTTLEQMVMHLSHLNSVKKDCVRSVPNKNELDLGKRGSTKGLRNGNTHDRYSAEGMHDRDSGHLSQRYSARDDEDTCDLPARSEDDSNLVGHSGGAHGGGSRDLVERYSASSQNGGFMLSGGDVGSFVGGVFGGMPVGKAPGHAVSDGYRMTDQAAVGDRYPGGVVCDGDSTSDEAASGSGDSADGGEVEDFDRPVTETVLAFEGVNGIGTEEDGRIGQEYSATLVYEEREEGRGKGLSKVVSIQEQRTVFDDPEEVTDSQSSLTRGEERPQAASSSSSTFSSQVSWTSEGSPLVYSKRYTSPQLSLSMSGGDLIQQSLSHHTAHGHYSTVEVDIDPFAAEFRAGVDAMKCGTDATHTHGQNADCNISTHPKGERQIPVKAFQDPRFLEYIKRLDYEPKVQDYITFQMGVIGDLIEEQYSDKLNQAIDEIFIELVKQKFVSWDTFKEVSKRLLLQGSRVQDGIMLIPCFARQLLDYVPQLGSTIGHYTEEVLDTYASENIMGMGGWSSLMESYNQDVVFTEYSPDWQDPEAGFASSSPWHGPMNQAAPSPSLALGTLPVQKATHQVSSRSAMDPESSLPPIPLPTHPFPLRRCVSVEVLLGDERDSPPPAQPLYSRSTSISSLDLATPNTHSKLTFALSLFHGKNLITDSSNSPVTPSPLMRDRICLGTLPEESRLSSRRSSTCSVIILSGHTHNDENGFELVGVGVSESKSHITSYQSTESLTAIGGYMDHLYSSRERGSNSTTERVTPTSDTEDEQPDGTGRTTERRRSSVAEVFSPVAALTAHLVAFGCWYFSQR